MLRDATAIVTWSCARQCNLGFAPFVRNRLDTNRAVPARGKAMKSKCAGMTPFRCNLFRFAHPRLRLLQPVRHAHGAVHRRRSDEMLPGLLTLVRAVVELAEAGDTCASRLPHWL
jgi:hypothetical protein